MWSEQKLDEMLTTPGDALIGDLKKIKGDIMILGAGGKMGPTLALLARNAVEAAGTAQKVIAVSRFTDAEIRKMLTDRGVETISIDLLGPDGPGSLPDAANVIYMAGRKFGTEGREYTTWATNCWLSALVAEQYKRSRIVVFSSGNIYPLVPLSSGGATEEVPPAPNGEYGMSVLGRERMFEYASHQYGTDVLLYRLNYAVDLRYGVLFDLAKKIVDGVRIPLSTPAFNCIWQGDANEIALRSLLLAEHPAAKLNVTGPETVSVRYAAEQLAGYLHQEVVFDGEPQQTAYLSNSTKCASLFGYPSVTVAQMLRWQAEWILAGGRELGKATHFEERDGKY